MEVKIYRMSWLSEIHNKPIVKYFYSRMDYYADVSEAKTKFMPAVVDFEMLSIFNLQNGPWEIVDALGLPESPGLLGPALDW
ncbi:hypothetical protein SAMN03092900_0771 [Thiomicrospira sp. ALE5]|nr:hypothetical protein SAMN03092900_0771 [Thiomicrospira sp. ALE5]